MDIHKDCYSAIDLTQQDGPHRRETFKRARRELKFLRTRLGRIIRDIRRQIEGDPALEDRFGPLLDLALRKQRQIGPKVYSLHAPEVECIGKGKARAPYEFGCKVSIVTPVTMPKGGQFVLHASTTRAIAAITIPIASRSGSVVRSGVSRKPSATRCGGAPPSSL
jgi:hypothetical protein